MTYKELVKRAATVGIVIKRRRRCVVERTAVYELTCVGHVQCAYIDKSDAKIFLEGVSAALDAVEAMQAERKPAGEMPKGGAA